MDIIEFEKLPLMGILRGIELDSLEPLMETVMLAGMQTMEITMNTPNADSLLRKAVKVAKKRLMIGAGTVLTMESLNIALSAGASFIVMPTFVEKIVKYCLKNKIPVFAGALTPQEIYNAWSYGVTMVKVFPASVFGPKYFKYLKGPFADVALMAVGGVYEENIGEYFSCGAEAVAIGESIFNKEQISSGNFKVIEQALCRIVETVKSCLSHK